MASWTANAIEMSFAPEARKAELRQLLEDYVRTAGRDQGDMLLSGSSGVDDEKAVASSGSDGEGKNSNGVRSSNGGHNSNGGVLAEAGPVAPAPAVGPVKGHAPYMSQRSADLTTTALADTPSDITGTIPTKDDGSVASPATKRRRVVHTT